MAAIAKRQRLGVFGGTFDPPHNGHLVIAEEALQQLELTKVIFVPAFFPPHKAGEGFASPAQRSSMVTLAIRSNPRFELSQLELRRKGTSYTVDTLRTLRKQHQQAELFLILGSDNLEDFRIWKSPDEVMTLASLVVYEREGFEIEKTEDSILRRVVRLSGVRLAISSSLIRRRVRAGKSIRYIVPDAVRNYIKAKELYKV